MSWRCCFVLKASIDLWRNHCTNTVPLFTGRRQEPSASTTKNKFSWITQGRSRSFWFPLMSSVCVCVCVCDLLLTINCVHKYKSVLYHKWHFQRQILARSWIVGYSLFKVIGNGTIRYIAYEFLFVCNSGLDKYLHQILWEMHHGHAEMNAWPKVELEVNLRDVIKWTSEA